MKKLNILTRSYWDVKFWTPIIKMKIKRWFKKDKIIFIKKGSSLGHSELLIKRNDR